MMETQIHPIMIHIYFWISFILPFLYMHIREHTQRGVWRSLGLDVHGI